MFIPHLLKASRTDFLRFSVMRILGRGYFITWMVPPNSPYTGRGLAISDSKLGNFLTRKKS